MEHFLEAGVARLYTVPGGTPNQVLQIANSVSAEGGRALLVGGCVRDELMGRQPKDWDLEIYGIEPARLREILDRFGAVNVVGEAFTVYKLGPHLDVSIPRRERKTGRGHRAFFIEGNPSMSIKEATSRRDFTINAILQDPLPREIIDPLPEAKAMDAKLLRALSPQTFSEDSLQNRVDSEIAPRCCFL